MNNRAQKKRDRKLKQLAQTNADYDAIGNQTDPRARQLAHRRQRLAKELGVTEAFAASYRGPPAEVAA